MFFEIVYRPTDLIAFIRAERVCASLRTGLVVARRNGERESAVCFEAKVYYYNWLASVMSIVHDSAYSCVICCETGNTGSP